MDAPDDRELVARLKAGQPAAFALVYERHRARVYAFILRMTRRRDVADDLLQETWLRLARKAPDLAPDVTLAAWLFTVARNLVVSWMRWHALDLSRVLEFGARRDEASPRTPDEDASAAEARQRLENGLAALKPVYREALLFVAVEGLEPAEAAKIVGIRPEAFRQRLSRARALLAETLGEDR